MKFNERFFLQSESGDWYKELFTVIYFDYVMAYPNVS